METFYIREETPVDFPRIHQLIETAFQTARVKDGTEQDFTDRLRAAGGYVPELALVAVEKDELIGQVMLTRTPLRRESGRHEVRCLLLAPLSVLLEHRGGGVGAALVREGLRRARELGYEAVFLAGDPAYYNRFGFRSAAEYGVVYTGPVPQENVLALELTPDVLAMSEFEFREV